MKYALAMLLALLGIVAGALSVALADAPVASKKIILVAPIEGMIDMGLAPFIERTLHEADQANATLVILDVNTFGGRVDTAVAIRDQLLRSRVPTVAFVNKRAISAGALISLAAGKIVMAQGGTIGAATPVRMGEPGGGTTSVDEKTVSYVRKEFRATADARQRPGRIAEAMVDADVEIDGLIEKGKLLTLTTEEALEHGVADARADNHQELLAVLGHAGAKLVPAAPNWAEHAVRFLTHPAIASLLMTLALLGIAVELRTPGFGIPGIVGGLSLITFFWGHWLVELVGWEQLLLVGVGVILILLEVFVIPGFGVAGVLGIIALVAGLSSSLFGAGASVGAIVHAVLRVAISAALAVVAALVAWRFIGTRPLGQKFVLGTSLAHEPRADPEDLPPLEGVVGTALTPLHPAGIASLAGRRVDVVSQGDFIEAGQPVEVVRDERHRVVVKLHSKERERS